MPRMVRDSKLENRTQRAALAPRSKEYIRLIETGLHIAYRKPQEGAGAWCKRLYLGGGKYTVTNLRTATGTVIVADDIEDANGVTVMSFKQAQDMIRDGAPSAVEAAEVTAEDGIIVTQAIERYRLDLVARGKKPSNATDILKHLPEFLGKTQVLKLKKVSFQPWHDALLAAGVKLATVDRLNKGLKAALTLAVANREGTVNTPWTDALAMKSTGERKARNVILSDDVVLGLVAEAYKLDTHFGEFAETAAQTGARPSQLAQCQIADLDVSNPALPKLSIPCSAKGQGDKASHVTVPLPVDLARKLLARTNGRHQHELLLTRNDGTAWAVKTEKNAWDGRWDGLMDEAVVAFDPALAAPGIDRVTFYALRHSAIARELKANVPTQIVAAGHDTSVKIIGEHYARYINDHADHLVRAALLGSAPVLKLVAA